MARRKNRALKEMDTCILDAKDMYPKIWYKEINFAEYFQNIQPLWSP